MSWLNNIGDAVGGAVDHAYSAADAGGGSWWDTAMDWGTTAFQWMEDNPTTANVLGGVVGGAGQYLAQKSLQDREAKMQREQWDRERQSQMISPGNVNNYGSHGGQFSGGLLTGGQIAGYRGLRDRKEV